MNIDKAIRGLDEFIYEMRMGGGEPVRIELPRPTFKMLLVRFLELSSGDVHTDGWFKYRGVTFIIAPPRD